METLWNFVLKIIIYIINSVLFTTGTFHFSFTYRQLLFFTWSKHAILTGSGAVGQTEVSGTTGSTPRSQEERELCTRGPTIRTRNLPHFFYSTFRTAASFEYCSLPGRQDFRSKQNSRTFRRRRRYSREISSVVAPADCAVGRARNNLSVFTQENWLCGQFPVTSSLIIIYSTTWQRRTPSLYRTLRMWWVVIVKLALAALG